MIIWCTHSTHSNGREKIGEQDVQTTSPASRRSIRRYYECSVFSKTSTSTTEVMRRRTLTSNCYPPRCQAVPSPGWWLNQTSLSSSNCGNASNNDQQAVESCLFYGNISALNGWKNYRLKVKARNQTILPFLPACFDNQSCETEQDWNTND